MQEMFYNSIDSFSNGPDPIARKRRKGQTTDKHLGPKSNILSIFFELFSAMKELILKIVFFFSVMCSFIFRACIIPWIDLWISLSYEDKASLKMIQLTSGGIGYFQGMHLIINIYLGFVWYSLYIPNLIATHIINLTLIMPFRFAYALFYAKKLDFDNKDDISTLSLKPQPTNTESVSQPVNIENELPTKKRRCRLIPEHKLKASKIAFLKRQNEINTIFSQETSPNKSLYLSRDIKQQKELKLEINSLKSTRRPSLFASIIVKTRFAPINAYRLIPFATL
jgi:hypothetical protein